jgi:hypothetical protein
MSLESRLQSLSETKVNFNHWGRKPEPKEPTGKTIADRVDEVKSQVMKRVEAVKKQVATKAEELKAEAKKQIKERITDKVEEKAKEKAKEKACEVVDEHTTTQRKWAAEKLKTAFPKPPEKDQICKSISQLLIRLGIGGEADEKLVKGIEARQALAELGEAVEKGTASIPKALKEVAKIDRELARELALKGAKNLVSGQVNEKIKAAQLTSKEKRRKMVLETKAKVTTLSKAEVKELDELTTQDTLAKRAKEAMANPQKAAEKGLDGLPIAKGIGLWFKKTAQNFGKKMADYLKPSKNETRVTTVVGMKSEKVKLFGEVRKDLYKGVKTGVTKGPKAAGEALDKSFNA